jgi:hypothetical protein
MEINVEETNVMISELLPVQLTIYIYIQPTVDSKQYLMLTNLFVICFVLMAFGYRTYLTSICCLLTVYVMNLSPHIHIYIKETRYVYKFFYEKTSWRMVT